MIFLLKFSLVLAGVNLAVFNLDADSSRLLNSVVNLLTLVILYVLRRETKPKVEETANKMDQIEGMVRRGLGERTGQDGKAWDGVERRKCP